MLDGAQHLSPNDNDKARWFIILIDTPYDQRVKRERGYV